MNSSTLYSPNKASFSANSLYLSLGSIVYDFYSNIAPASNLKIIERTYLLFEISINDIPVSVSFLYKAVYIGEAPLNFGNKEGWITNIPFEKQLIIASGIIYP